MRAFDTALGNGEDRGSKSYVFLLLPGASMLSFSAAVEPLRMANKLSIRTVYEWLTVSLDGESLQFSNGVNVAVDGRCLLPDKPDFAFVVAGNELSAGQEKSAARWLYTHYRAGARVGSVGGGARIMAQAGLLEDRAFTLHWEDQPGFRERHPFLDPEDRLYCEDDNVITCGGGMAAADLTLNLIEQDFDRDFAMSVSEMCVHFGLRQGEERPKSSISMTLGSRNPHLITATRIMSDNLEDILPMDFIARSSGVSRRQLERLFKTYTGRSPASFYRDLRLERGRQLLRDTDYKVIAISAACGFSSVTSFSRSFRKKFGFCPIQSRKV
ncbi:GlxA family transcriptional regulator [Ruegeria lacuscaerulensis]|uniref:GlxA family transcriptional regulator n=1 Tax=Ruegeria lacuscaerulensis TaxID=55218 RepID=UPI00147CA43A|nr:GlxA family transcriptional regulator [Ruegeria lacuscaerulensis]